VREREREKERERESVSVCVRERESLSTGCLKLQVIFRKRASNYRVLLRKMTCKDKASCGSSLPYMMRATRRLIRPERETEREQERESGRGKERESESV